MSTIFNATNQYAGFYQAYSGTDTAITISRAGYSQTVDAEDGEGFMVSQYEVVFQRNVGIQRFMNMKAAVANIGIGNGSMRLTGLVGRAEAFKKLLVGSDDNKEDICSQLTVQINEGSSFVSCTGNNAANKAGAIKCSGGIVSGIQLGGQIDQAGVLLQTGSLTITFTGLELI